VGAQGSVAVVATGDWEGGQRQAVLVGEKAWKTHNMGAKHLAQRTDARDMLYACSTRSGSGGGSRHGTAKAGLCQESKSR
jgi:hypothetical protein